MESTIYKPFSLVKGYPFSEDSRQTVQSASRKPTSDIIRHLKPVGSPSPIPVRKSSDVKRMSNNPHSVWPQVLGAFCASLGTLIVGAVRGWASPGIPSLFESGKVGGLDAQVDEAWIASTPQLCAIAGALLVSWPLQKFGRKWTMVAMSIPWIIGFLLVGLAQNKAMIYAGRVLAGLMEGTIGPSAQITECSSPEVRGVLGSATAVNQVVGALVSFIVGAYVPFDVLSLILIVFPVLFGISVAFLPESPVWLMIQQKETKARNALQYYRGKQCDVTEEFEKMRESVDKTMKVEEKISASDLCQSSVWKPLLISMALMFFQQFCGFNVVIIYTVKIFSLAGNTVDKHMATIIVGAVFLVGGIVSAYLVDFYGRRILLFVSGITMFTSLFALGAFFYLKEEWGGTVAEQKLGWLPLASLIIFILGFSAGFGSVPFIIMGELFPMRFRHILSPFSSSFCSLSTFVIVRTFPDLAVAFQLYGVFWFYASCTVCAVVFVYFFLPETKGKTLEDIEKLFSAERESEKDSSDLKREEHCVSENSVRCECP